MGLEVVPNTREVLIDLYTKTLKEIQVVPEDEGYKKAVESFTSHRPKLIEKKLGCGQVEELIEEAQDELTLIGKMIVIEEKKWLVDEDED
ncbi:putative nadh dehydrogenase [ubiquinone] 1 alpha subcomplex subunit 5 [Quercus suber]|uniref:Nadh dehydrogenase [ubiquinone] 1 alpha subcomplex subunit 5 n=1 Tax=Quercus suber TaxID=58331 RepID=A0AAW0KY44_QUESU